MRGKSQVKHLEKLLRIHPLFELSRAPNKTVFHGRAISVVLQLCAKHWGWNQWWFQALGCWGSSGQRLMASDVNMSPINSITKRSFEMSEIWRALGFWLPQVWYLWFGAYDEASFSQDWETVKRKIALEKEIKLQLADPENEFWFHD